MAEKDLNARAQDAENVAFEDVLTMSLEELQRIAPALEARALAASKIADEAVANAADAIAIASAAQGRLHTLQEERGVSIQRASQSK
jgi:hypothetical protein